MSSFKRHLNLHIYNFLLRIFVENSFVLCNLSYTEPSQNNPKDTTSLFNTIATIIVAWLLWILEYFFQKRKLNGG